VGKTKYSITGGNEYCYGFEWSPSGNSIISTWKDKHTRMIDPRSEKVVVDFVAHDGTRAHKSAWIGVNGHEDLIVSLGFNKTMERELKIFDLRNPSVTVQHD
jgi:hypothetical protein